LNSIVRFIIFLFISCAIASGAHAQTPSTDGSTIASEAESTSEYRVKLEEKESRLLFGLYGQMSQFKREGISLTGYNFEGMVNYAIWRRTAVALSLNQSLDMANGISVLFTGVRLGAAYAIWGEYLRKSSLLKVNNQDTLSVHTPDSAMLVTDVGIEQYLFNGTDRIVPATGLSLGLRYDKNVMGLRVSAMVRYGSLVISEDPVAMLTAGIGALMRF
jgi:hypothetical protein